MEYGLRLGIKVGDNISLDMSLNPCFNGIWSATAPLLTLSI